MLPLVLLKAAEGKPMLVELKNGETFNGHLVGCDNFMNIVMKEVFQTSASGTSFYRLEEVYIRGNQIKYIRVSDSVIDSVREKEHEAVVNARARGGGGVGGRDGGGGGGGGRGGMRGRGRGGRGGPSSSSGGDGGGRGGGGRGGGGRGGGPGGRGGGGGGGGRGGYKR